MLVSSKTYEILKNFQGINTGLVFRVGKKQATTSLDEDILAEATLEDDIPCELGIFDLSKFLGNLSTLDNPTMEFNSNFVKITDQDTEIKFYSCKPSLLVSPRAGADKLNMSNVDLHFTIPSATLSKALKIAATNISDRIVFGRTNNKLYITVKNAKDKDANSAKILLKEDEGNDVSLGFSVDILTKLLSSVSYDVKIDTTQHEFGLFTATDGSIRYFIAGTTD